MASAITAVTPLADLEALNGTLTTAQLAVQAYLQVRNPGRIAGANAAVDAVSAAITEVSGE